MRILSQMMGDKMNTFPILQRAVRRVGGSRLDALIHDRRGAAAVTIALAFTAIAGLAGLGAETATWYYTQRKMQGAADAAAHTGATALMMGVGSPAAKIQACSVALNFANSPTPDFTCDPNTNVYIPPRSGSHTGATDAVEVDLSQSPSLMFSGMFMSSTPTISVRSVATASANTNPPCVMALDTNSEPSLSTNGTPALALNSCSLYVNSSGTNALNMGGGTINAAAAYVVGGMNGSGLTTTNGLHTGVPPHPDPYAYLSNPTSVPGSPSCGSTNNDHVSGNKTETWCKDHPGGTFVFNNGVQVDGGSTLNLCPGTYYVNGGTVTLQGGAILNAPPTANTTPPMSSSLCGTNTTGGVTIILMNNTTGGNPANLNFTANSVANLTAPTSGTYSGVSIFQERTTCSGNSTQCANSLDGGGTQNIQGAIYVPNNSVDFQGGASSGALAATCTQLFAYKINFSGTSNLNTSCASAGTQTVYVTSSSLVE
jgi:Flp pilus assembly protein TadG